MTTSNGHRSAGGKRRGSSPKNSTPGLPHPAAARRAAGLSQRALAKLAKTNQATVCRFETAGAYPTHYLLRARYLAALGLTEGAS